MIAMQNPRRMRCSLEPHPQSVSEKNKGLVVANWSIHVIFQEHYCGNG